MSDGLQLVSDLGKINDGLQMEGQGLDWSPRGDLLVRPKAQTVTALNGQDAGVVTGLFLGDTQGNDVQQITFPRTDTQRTYFPVSLLVWTEHDYHPVFSPSGNEIAYFRAFDAWFTGETVVFPQRQPARTSLRIVLAILTATVNCS